MLGEGEQTFLELAKNSFNPDRKIAGLCFDGAKTSDRGLIEPLDNIPHPDRSIYNLGARESYLFTSRGCSYRCKFCSSSRFWKKVRFHSPEYVAEELLQLKNTGVRHVNIYDELFCLVLNGLKPFGMTVYLNRIRLHIRDKDYLSVLSNVHGAYWCLRFFKIIWTKRLAVQQIRTVSDNNLFRRRILSRTISF